MELTSHREELKPFPNERPIRLMHHAILGIYNKEPADIAKTISRPKAPAICKVFQWRAMSAPNGQCCEMHNAEFSNNRKIEGANTTESPVIAERYKNKRCGHPVVSLF